MQHAAGQLTETQLLDLSGESCLKDVRQLTLRGQGLSSFPFTASLPALEGLSLSHNHLNALVGFSSLALLVSWQF